VVLGVPCNQFGAQEPGTEDEILSFVRENYGEPFQLMAKVDVNGDDANPLYRMLREALPKADGNGDIAWNFTKFLVGGDGTPLKRYEPQVEPEEIQADLANFRS
jgi:glutathione peroxidase